MIGSRTIGGTVAYLAVVASAVAAPIPRWAVGRWVATTALLDIDGSAEEVGFFERSFSDSLAKLLPQTELDITGTSISAAPGGVLTLVAARHVAAHVFTQSADILMINRSQPSLFGDKLAYDLHDRVAAARLTIHGCAEASVEGQTTRPAFKPVCRSNYTLLRFPDDDHLAVWSANGSEMVILRRQTPSS